MLLKQVFEHLLDFLPRQLLLVVALVCGSGEALFGFVGLRFGVAFGVRGVEWSWGLAGGGGRGGAGFVGGSELAIGFEGLAVIVLPLAEVQAVPAAL